MGKVHYTKTLIITLLQIVITQFKIKRNNFTFRSLTVTQFILLATVQALTISFLFSYHPSLKNETTGKQSFHQLLRCSQNLSEVLSFTSPKLMTSIVGATKKIRTKRLSKCNYNTYQEAYASNENICSIYVYMLNPTVSSKVEN